MTQKEGYIYLGQCKKIYGRSKLVKFKSVFGNDVKMLTTGNKCIFVFVD